MKIIISQTKPNITLRMVHEHCIKIEPLILAMLCCKIKTTQTQSLLVFTEDIN